MQYAEKSRLVAVRKDGKVRKPPYVGLIVLMDYLAPRYANAYRTLSREFHQRLRDVNATLPKTFGDAEWREEYKAQRTAQAPAREWYRKAFARLCERAWKERI